MNVSEIDKKCAKGWIKLAEQEIEKGQYVIAASYLELARRCLTGEVKLGDDFEP